MQPTHDADFYAWAIDVFPADCPFAVAQLLDPDYWAE